MHGVTQCYSVVFAAAAAPTLAFDNGVSDMALYAGTAKKTGTPPPDLGLRDRTLPSSRSAQGVLRACDAAPNCRGGRDEAHSLPVWRPPSPDTALAELLDALKSYSPGQLGIDGGGFKVVRSTPTYVYVEFESLRYGFVDDVEFALGGPPCEVHRRGKRPQPECDERFGTGLRPFQHPLYSTAHTKTTQTARHTGMTDTPC